VNKLKRYIAAGLITLTLGGGFIFASKKARAKGSENSYRIYTTKKNNFEKSVEVDGVVEARDTKLVYADRNLKVNDVIYKEGDYVKKGEVIMTFDPEDKNKLARELRKEEINLRMLQRDLRNAVELHGAGGISRVEMENIEFDIKKSLINIEDYEEEMAKMLDFIVSPFDGTIISMIAEENYRVNTEVELFEMANLSDIIIVAEVPEYNINGIMEGQKTTVRLDSHEDEFEGVVSKISTLSTATTSKNDSSSSNTTEAYVEVEVTVNNLPEGVRPGFNSKVGIITSSSSDTVAIPRTSLLENAGEEFVFLIDENNIARKKPVKTGISSGKLIEVTNLDIRKRVVIDPDNTIKDGDLLVINLDNSRGRDGGEKKRP